MANINVHPDWGSYDRLLFNSQGFAVPSAAIQDELGNRIGLTNFSLVIENEQAKKHTGKDGDHPLLSVYDADIRYGPYAIVVDDGISCEDNDENFQNSIFYMITRVVNNKTEFMGGLTAYALNKAGEWKGIHKATYNSFCAWVIEHFMTDLSKDQLTAWLNLVKKSAEIRLARSPEDLISVKGRAITVVPSEPKTETPKVEEEDEKDIPPVLLTGSTHSLDKIGTYLEKVA